MLLLLTSLALATEMVTLHVGIHREAGGPHDIAVDGAAGQCSVGIATISCPVNDGEAVRFRWGPGGDWKLSGTTLLTPEMSEGTAWVFAAHHTREAERARLADMESVTPDDVRELFVRRGAEEPPVPSIWMIWALFDLVGHPDNMVRRQVVEALFPWVRDTYSDPLPREAPEIVPDGLILQLARDEDFVVRRKTCALIREVSRGGLHEEAGQAIKELITDPERSVRRVCLSAMRQAPDEEMIPAEETWHMAMKHVEEERAGRAATATLGKLRTAFGDEVPESVDPHAAIELALHRHPEKTWGLWRAWRREVPFDREWALFLLQETAGLSKPLLDHWAVTAPDGLAEVIRRWEPQGPHSERFRVVQNYLSGVQNSEVREALELPPPTPPSDE